MSDVRTLSSLKQQDLLAQFKAARAQTEYICEPLQPEDFVVQPVIDVSPPKWHLAHTTWFFENFVLKDHVDDYKLFDDDYHFLFNSYYETEGDRWIRSERGSLSRPWVNEIMAYRQYVNEHMENFLSNSRLDVDLLDLLEIGIHHEQQHQELMLYDIKHILGINPLFPVYRQHYVEKELPNLSVTLLSVPEGTYDIGFEGQGFHFDNEEGRHRVFLEAYEIQDRLVTIGEYLEFIEAGAYLDFRFWLMEGFEWVKSNKIKAPFYWFKEGEDWFRFTLSGKEPLDLAAPVSHISYYEADAFAKWKGMRLPTEFEWEVACQLFEPIIPSQANFLDKGNLRTMPRVGDHKQFYGDAWEWTSSAYLPYPYYQAPEGAIGEYNGKFMVNQMVLRGGSFATMEHHIRPTYRNFFHPHLRWHFTGFRLARHQ
jgi:ergothioneine biosynthesis protein EgtB